jgi:predicted small secreted protein
MRHAGLLLALLATATQLPACVTTAGSPGDMKGQSGPVTWEIVDIRQSLEDNGSKMRWDYNLVFKNVSDMAVEFERMETNSRAGGSVDMFGGIDTTPFARQLAPRGELRVNRSWTFSCSRCAPGHMPRFFGDGVIVYHTFFGHDGAGRDVRVPIAIRLNSSVGVRTP